MAESKAAALLRHIAIGLCYMQERGIMHRDLKLANILISDDCTKIKIIDFGLAVQLNSLEEER